METEYAREVKTGAPGTKATLVLGGTGQTGRRVAEELAARGLPIRVGSRSGEMPFDWGDEATWTPALRDVGTVYVSYYPDLAVQGAVQGVRSFAALAMQQGVRRLVLLSGRGEEEAQCAERAVQEVGAEWTILELELLQPELQRELLPGADPRRRGSPPGRGCARAVRRRRGHRRRRGSSAHGGRARGRALRTDRTQAFDLRRGGRRDLSRRRPQGPLRAHLHGGVRLRLESGWGTVGSTEPMIYLFTKVLDGRNAHLTAGVRRALGREPKDFADYARDTAITDV